jgi:hypothetical protein
MAHEISRRGVLLAGLATGAMAATGGHPPAAAMVTSTARGASRPLALAGVTVVDFAGSRLRPDTTVLVRGERIITVGRRDEVGIPHGAVTCDRCRKTIQAWRDRCRYHRLMPASPSVCPRL